jgi:aminopeptidase N
MNRISAEAGVEDGAYASYRLLQSAATPSLPTLRSHRLALGVYDLVEGRLTKRTGFQLDVSGAVTDVPQLQGQPQAALVLINDGDLAFAKTRVDPPSLQTLSEHLSELEDPVSRAVAWNSLWDMTRDGELPSSRFSELVAAHLRDEQEPLLVERILTQALGAVDLYGRSENRAGARARMAAAARYALEHSPPASDLQLVWARNLIAFSDDDDLTFLDALLQERTAVDGLAVDTDLRWRIVRRLAAAAYIDDAAVRAELERDPTDIGRREAAAARAGMPSAEAKAMVWTRLVEEGGVPMATMGALMGGFHQPDQAELLEPYVQRYVTAVPRLWRERGIDEAEALTGGLFPNMVIEPATLEAMDRLLEDSTLTAPARRILAEGRDNLDRAIRGRAADAVPGQPALR